MGHRKEFRVGMDEMMILCLFMFAIFHTSYLRMHKLKFYGEISNFSRADPPPPLPLGHALPVLSLQIASTSGEQKTNKTLGSYSDFSCALNPFKGPFCGRGASSFGNTVEVGARHTYRNHRLTARGPGKKSTRSRTTTGSPQE